LVPGTKVPRLPPPKVDGPLHVPVLPGVPPSELNKFTLLPLEHKFNVPLVPALTCGFTVIGTIKKSPVQVPIVGATVYVVVPGELVVVVSVFVIDDVEPPDAPVTPVELWKYENVAPTGVLLNVKFSAVPLQMVVVPDTEATGTGFTVMTALPVKVCVHAGVPLDVILTKLYVVVAEGAPALTVALPDPFKVTVWFDPPLIL
jgi:hypothetical protein